MAGVHPHSNLPETQACHIRMRKKIKISGVKSEKIKCFQDALPVIMAHVKRLGLYIVVSNLCVYAT